MTCKEQLIELLETGGKIAMDKIHEEIREDVEKNHKYNSKEDKTSSLTEIIADYLLNNGVTVLPCKVGDTVYFLATKYEKQGRKKVPVEYVDIGWVDNIVFGCLGVPQVHVCDKNNVWTTFDGSKDFGKIIFLDKRSAEKALRKRENNG